MFKPYQKITAQNKTLNKTSPLVLMITALLIAILFFYFLIQGVNKSEQIECQTWSKQAAANTHYYFADWQIKQCAHHHLPLLNH